MKESWFGFYLEKQHMRNKTTTFQKICSMWAVDFQPCSATSEERQTKEVLVWIGLSSVFLSLLLMIYGSLRRETHTAHWLGNLWQFFESSRCTWQFLIESQLSIIWAMITCWTVEQVWQPASAEGFTWSYAEAMLFSLKKDFLNPAY